MSTDTGIATTTDIEKDNLEAHVELCWQRYQRFHDRLSRVEEKVDNLVEDVKSMREEYITEIKGLREENLKESRSVKTAIITSSATVIAGLIGLIAMLMNAPH